MCREFVQTRLSYLKCLTFGTRVLPEVLGRWYTRKHNTLKVDHSPNNDVCFCRTAIDEDTVICCNPECPIGSFHLSCLQIVSVPRAWWYCLNCRTLPKLILMAQWLFFPRMSSRYTAFFTSMNFKRTLIHV